MKPPQAGNQSIPCRLHYIGLRYYLAPRYLLITELGFHFKHGIFMYLLDANWYSTCIDKPVIERAFTLPTTR